LISRAAGSLVCAGLVLVAVAVTGCGGGSPPAGSARFAASAPYPITAEAGLAALQAQVLRGRHLVVAHGCGDCHGGNPNPAADGWMAGKAKPDEAFVMGDYRVWPRNLTPDAETGIGRYTDRQLFNALRFGLRPGETPDVVITSTAPGVGNHPVQPNYLAPVMVWQSYRHLPDDQIRDIIAYLRQLQPVRNEIPEGVRPPDYWASEFTPEWIGNYPVAPFPTAQEELTDPARRSQVLQGRSLVVTLACGDCHGGRGSPASPRWLRGVLPAGQRIQTGPFEAEFVMGPYHVYPRNLTPDNRTGLGRFSERQIFNALRYGLRPGETADIEITSTVPGEGNHPLHPKYLAPSMPWPAWRHLTDTELWSIAAYLKHGLRPADNRVPDSDGPPDFWAGDVMSGVFGPYPAAPFPTARERSVNTAAGDPRR
jgi:mono/diheme cytochrome c family protein